MQDCEVRVGHGEHSGFGKRLGSTAEHGLRFDVTILQLIGHQA